MLKVDILGKKFGRLTVISGPERNQKGLLVWRCVCECGGEKVDVSGHLRSGFVQSCGCLHRDGSRLQRHGMSKTRFWQTWMGMKARCLNSNSPFYRHYGGRGITVCERWMRFENFQEDMMEGYSDNLTIDRIDVNKGYSKENCRWATKQEQARNTTRNIDIEYNGVTKRIYEWAEDLGIPYQTLYNRIFIYRRTLDDALSSKRMKHKVKNPRRGRPIVKLDNNGNMIERFISIRQAANSVGEKSLANIWLCAQGKIKICRGFRWAYGDES